MSQLQSELFYYILTIIINKWGELNMTRREYNRLKRRAKAHLKRAAVILVLVLAVVLMVCGCLYIGEHLFQKEEKTEENKDPVIENQVSDNTSVDETVVLDTDTQIKNTYNYEYKKPDAAGLSFALDAGHGGIDGGTESVAGTDVLEKDINLSITQKVAELLKEAGASVSMIREDDEYVDLAVRNTRGNETGADLFVSLHCNYYEGDSSIDGLEIYHHRNSEISKQYAEAMTQYMKDTNTIHVRDASQQNMQVLRNSSMPAVMIEMGFLSNPEEAAKLSDSLYQDFLARMITDSLVETLKAPAGE